MDIEQMRISMGEMAAEIERLTEINKQLGAITADVQVLQDRLSICASEREQYRLKIESQQSPAVAVPDLDYVDGDILPPVGASVAIHLASCDKWLDHTVVGYYVWGPLGGIDSAYSRVFVRVVDSEGILNARLLKDVKWDKSTPLRSLRSPRITEQDALPVGYREEWKRNVMLMWACVRKHDSSIPSDVLDFMREQLLTKLNDKNNIPN